MLVRSRTPSERVGDGRLARRSPLARLARLLLTFALVLVAGVALASTRVDFLAKRLKYPPADDLPDDFRVRTQAALALGGMNDDDAVDPLCGGLSDPKEIVRRSCAVALKRLGRTSALACLKARRDVEDDDGVKVEIQRTIDALSPSGAKFYVSIGPVTNHTNRSNGDIQRIVNDAILAKLSAVGGYMIAPASESSARASAVISQNSLHGYYLAPSVDAFDYSGGGLRAHIKIAIFTYPGKALKGESPGGASISGVSEPDHGSEDQLLQAIADAAADGFTKGFQ